MAPTIRHCDASGNATAGCQEIGYVRTALRATRTEGALLLLAVSMCIFAIAEGGDWIYHPAAPFFFAVFRFKKPYARKNSPYFRIFCPYFRKFHACFCFSAGPPPCISPGYSPSHAWLADARFLKYS